MPLSSGKPSVASYLSSKNCRIPLFELRSAKEKGYLELLVISISRKASTVFCPPYTESQSDSTPVLTS